MKNSIKVVLICLICLIGFIIINQSNNDNDFNKNNLPPNWQKDANEVMNVYINAINTKDLELMDECIFNMDGYDYSYLGFSKYPKDILDNIKYIKYIDSEEASFKTVEGKLKNGKSIFFKEGKVLDVEYKIKFKIENQPEKSGVNDQRYTLIKDENENYKIISAGY